jgi:hypothetical protein
MEKRGKNGEGERDGNDQFVAVCFLLLFSVPDPGFDVFLI